MAGFVFYPIGRSNRKALFRKFKLYSDSAAPTRCVKVYLIIPEPLSANQTNHLPVGAEKIHGVHFPYKTYYLPALHNSLEAL